MRDPPDNKRQQSQSVYSIKQYRVRNETFIYFIFFLFFLSLFVISQLTAHGKKVSLSHHRRKIHQTHSNFPLQKSQRYKRSVGIEDEICKSLDITCSLVAAILPGPKMGPRRQERGKKEQRKFSRVDLGLNLLGQRPRKQQEKKMTWILIRNDSYWSKEEEKNRWTSRGVFQRYMTSRVDGPCNCLVVPFTHNKGEAKQEAKVEIIFFFFFYLRRFVLPPLHQPIDLFHRFLLTSLCCRVYIDVIKSSHQRACDDRGEADELLLYLRP